MVRTKQRLVEGEKKTLDIKLRFPLEPLSGQHVSFAPKISQSNGMKLTVCCRVPEKVNCLDFNDCMASPLAHP